MQAFVTREGCMGAFATAPELASNVARGVPAEGLGILVEGLVFDGLMALRPGQPLACWICSLASRVLTCLPFV